MTTFPRSIPGLLCILSLAACTAMPDSAICQPGDHACVNRKVQAQTDALRTRTVDMPQAAPATAPAPAATPAPSDAVPRSDAGDNAASQKPSRQTLAPRRAAQRYSPPVSVAPVTPAAAAASATPAPGRPPAVSMPQANVTPPAPAPITSCDAGGCWSSGGGRYQSGAGNTYFDNAGKLCQRQGAWMQCF